jgi:hypothetical protein
MIGVIVVRPSLHLRHEPGNSGGALATKHAPLPCLAIRVATLRGIHAI